MSGGRCCVRILLIKLTQFRKVPSTIGVTVVIPKRIRTKHSVVIGGVLIPTGGAGILEGTLLKEIMELVEVRLSGFGGSAAWLRVPQ